MTDVGQPTINLALAVGAASWAPSMRDNPWALVEEWFVDGENISGLASDSNIGTLETAPLRTKRQLAQRLGNSQLLHDQRVHLMSGQQAGDDAALRCDTSLNNICFYGRKTEVATGTFTDVTPAVVPASGATGGALAEIEDTTKPANFFDDFVGMEFIVHNVTADAYFHIKAGIGGSRARILTPLSDVDPLADFSNPKNFFFQTSPTMSSGDTYKIYQLDDHTCSLSATGGQKNFVGVGWVDACVEPAEEDYYSIKYSGLMMVRCGTMGYWSASAINSQSNFAGCWVGGLGFEFGAGVMVGGFLECIGYVSGYTMSFTGNVLMSPPVMSVTAGGLVHLAAAHITGVIDTNNVENGALGVSGSGSISVSPHFVLGPGYVYGAGTLRGHAGNAIRYCTSAAYSFRNAGGIALDAGTTLSGEQAFTVSSSGVSSFRTVSVANLDASVGAGGFSGNCQTVRGTRVVLAA